MPPKSTPMIAGGWVLHTRTHMLFLFLCLFFTLSFPRSLGSSPKSYVRGAYQAISHMSSSSSSPSSSSSRRILLFCPLPWLAPARGFSRYLGAILRFALWRERGQASVYKTYMLHARSRPGEDHTTAR
ncbi:hypothetical protein B0I35DRAFT_440005 [Stachybotrys elegans]|uniref:Uncharacterized protein n=1 Tax=Stachybotrys elegans TaxID=80388 RepID=A0A8K0WMC9_9HYPO|nr:hypothetical protein B0I35DRAFT_440005 [Stachybotrys elegans]